MIRSRVWDRDFVGIFWGIYTGNYSFIYLNYTIYFISIYFLYFSSFMYPNYFREFKTTLAPHFSMNPTKPSCGSCGFCQILFLFIILIINLLIFFLFLSFHCSFQMRLGVHYFSFTKNEPCKLWYILYMNHI